MRPPWLPNLPSGLTHKKLLSPHSFLCCFFNISRSHPKMFNEFVGGTGFSETVLDADESYCGGGFFARERASLRSSRPAPCASRGNPRSSAVAVKILLICAGVNAGFICNSRAAAAET